MKDNLAKVLLTLLMLIGAIAFAGTVGVIVYNFYGADSTETFEDLEKAANSEESVQEEPVGEEETTEEPKEEPVATEVAAEKQAHVHKYTDEVVKESTCERTGILRHACDCGNYYIDIVPALGHMPDEWKETKEPSTDAKGLRQKSCRRCSKLLNEEAIDKLQDDSHEHEYKETVTKQPGCVDTGVKTFTCDICDSSYTESIPATNHPNRETLENKATCTSPGSVITRCEDCGVVLSHDTMLMQHETQDWVIERKPTETTNGRMVKRCKKCDTILDRQTIPKVKPEKEEPTK